MLLTWHSYIPPSLRMTPVICRVQSGDPSWWRRARRGDEEKRMVPEERTVRCEEAGVGPERRTQEREAGPRWLTLQGSTTVAPTTAVRFKVDGPRNLGGRVGITCQCYVTR